MSKYTIVSDDLILKDGSFYVQVVKAQSPISLDYSLIADVEVEDIDMRDAPDFVDAFISSASYNGREMTDAELDVLNEDQDYVYQAVQAKLY